MMYAALGIFAGLSLNLILQFAIGIKSRISEEEKTETEVPGEESQPAAYGFTASCIQMLCLFLAILVFWIFYYFVLRAVPTGFFEYFLMFPLSCLICFGVETGAKKLLPERIAKTSIGACSKGTGSALTAYDGLALVSFVLTSRLAIHLLDGIILAFFFALGCLFVSAILSEITRRAFLEKVPLFIRGNPLLLISMGLLSMVFAAAAGICFRLFDFF